MKYCQIMLITIWIFISCEDPDNSFPADQFEVIVVGTGVDCKLPLIDFLKIDSTRINSLTGAGWLRYQAFNLDSTFSEVGTTLNVVVRKTYDKELYACTAWGPGYPRVTVIDADTFDL